MKYAQGKLIAWEELKTLKDIEREHIEAIEDVYRNDVDLEDELSDERNRWKELRAEAVKWIKQDDFWVDKDWIKHFFNLTKEDLKTGEKQ